MFSQYMKMEGRCHRLDWYPGTKNLAARTSEKIQLEKAGGWAGLAFSHPALSCCGVGYELHCLRLEPQGLVNARQDLSVRALKVATP